MSALSQTRGCHSAPAISHAVLNDPVLFPSRVVVSRAAAANFPNLARRLYRCLSHAWRHHPAVYATYEADTGTAGRFTALARRYSLLAEEQLLIPLPS